MTDPSIPEGLPTSAADIAWNVRNNIASAADMLERLSLIHI